MLYPIEELQKNLVKIEHHLMFHLIMEQKETNRLLSLQTPQQQDPADERDELVKRMNQLSDRPRGWHKWSTDKMADYLKEVS